MALNHVNIVDASLHEPKGVAGAVPDSSYVADGVGSGVWQKIKSTQIDTTSIKEINKKVLNVEIDDVSSASSVWVVSPFAGVISEVHSVINGTIATADTVITSKIGGVAVTGGGITITQAGSLAGDVDTVTPTGLNTVTAGQAIELAVNGASTNVVASVLTLVIDVS